MLRRSFGLLVVAALFSAAGCGDGGAEAVFLERLDDMNAYAEAIEKDAPAETVADLKTKLTATSKRFDDLKPSKSTLDRLNEKHADAIRTAGMRLAAAQASKGEVGAMPFMPGYRKPGNPTGKGPDPAPGEPGK
jgi:hypothetical protein